MLNVCSKNLASLIDQAKEYLQQCEANFDEAQGDYVAPAALELLAAKLRYSALMKELKELPPLLAINDERNVIKELYQSLIREAL